MSLLLLFLGKNIPTAEFENDIGRNCLLGHRKKIAKFLMRTFTCRSAFLYGLQNLISCVDGASRLCNPFYRRILFKCSMTTSAVVSSPPPPHEVLSTSLL
jgi:hypothetical protein